MAELYGVLDTDTRDWTDGLLSNIFREINKPLPAGKVSPMQVLPAQHSGCKTNTMLMHWQQMISSGHHAISLIMALQVYFGDLNLQSHAPVRT